MNDYGTARPFVRAKKEMSMNQYKQQTEALKAAEDNARELSARLATLEQERQAAAEERSQLDAERASALTTFAETGDDKALSAIDTKLAGIDKQASTLGEKVEAVRTAVSARKRPVYEAEQALREAHEQHWKSEETRALAKLAEVARPHIYRALSCRRAYDPNHYAVDRYVEVAVLGTLGLSEAGLNETAGEIPEKPAASEFLTDVERQGFGREIRRAEKLPYRERQSAEREAKLAELQAKESKALALKNAELMQEKGPQRVA